ncbi:MAG TPA: efflux RND transporter periplasmic adaptor subunit [Terriglobales bacterium]|nr:efflux RND transporter periplasmic adaptor subunit [Terriglobales bacterium]
MKERNYRNAFFAALVIAALFAVAAIYFWLQSPRGQTAQSASVPAQASPEPMEGMETQPAPATAPQAALAPVQISPQRLQSIGVKFAKVERKQLRDSLRVTGNVEIDEERQAYVQTRFPGWIQKVFADATYQCVRKGQPLFTVYSQELVSTEQEFLLALKNKQALAASQNVAGAQKEADWLVEAARQRLQQWNVPQREIAELEKTGKIQREITVESPASGYITERNALPNQFVQPETKLYTIADLSQVWVYAQVFQTDVGRLKSGDPATVTVDAYPSRVFRGRVQQVLPQVDPNTRTVRVRLIFDNPGLLLKPGMYVNIELGLPLGKQLVIPASGVLQSGTRQIAFVDHGNGYLEPHEIQTGSRVGDDVVVLKGLAAGERIVSSANFLVDSESQIQAAVGQFAPPPPGAGGAGGTAAISVPQQSVNLEFSTEPSPPHKGNNIFRVKLRDAYGKPIGGAQVSVTFYMPAMPAMGMSAMRTSATLTDKGNSLYEGSGTLGSGGTWQVTITAQQNGQILASKQMNVSATGGM